MTAPRLIATLFCLLILPLTVAAEEAENINHCKEPQSWVQWGELLKNNPGDDGIHAAYALRIGLCEMVDRKQIELARATAIFEHYMASLIEAKKARDNQEPPKGKI